MYLIPLVQYVIVGLLLLSVLRCEVTIQSLLQIKLRILWNNRFLFGKLFTSLNFILPCLLPLFAVFMVEDQIYALVLVSLRHRFSFYSKNGIGCRKEFLHLVLGQVSSNHKEQVVSKENSVALWFLNKRESTALSDPNCLFCICYLKPSGYFN